MTELRRRFQRLSCLQTGSMPFPHVLKQSEMIQEIDALSLYWLTSRVSSSRSQAGQALIMLGLQQRLEIR